LKYSYRLTDHRGIGLGSRFSVIENSAVSMLGLDT
jgi:hypothetical protein